VKVASFHSNAVRLDQLSARWTQLVLRLFPDPRSVNGRRVLVGDGIKVPKARQENAPGLKRLHQQSNANTKPEEHHGKICRVSVSDAMLVGPADLVL
jgi:hypothetical protein